MEGTRGTASLRNTAVHWSLAGDKQLLDLLQNLHERIVTKCQEANSSLEEMVNSLDTASISLQNVNNRLMALSNSQFVESRVYEDDVDVAARDPPVKEPPKATDHSSELSKLRDSLRVLESYHEPVHIVDSDSDSGSDEEEDRMVLKAKDLYAERPLPYLIGSQQWRTKWHAGLVAEDSDSDSDTSKVNAPPDQYSDSEPEGQAARDARPHASQRTISTNSSLGSELTIPPAEKPADIAAELARRLGAAAPPIPEPQAESPPAAPAPPVVYRPQQPVTATLFSDEPPPLDAGQSDSEDDVFAELHRSARRAAPAGPAAFDDDLDRGRQPPPSAKQPSPLIENTLDSELFGDKAESGLPSIYSDTQPDTVKKPVGGISLFGNNKGAESIGAAILKRNRKDSTSDEEPQQTSKFKENTQTNKVKREAAHNSSDKIQQDIINDLFSKANKTKQTHKKVDKTSPVKIEIPASKKVDLFTDDLFDDIDDIFTNVKPPVKEVKESIKKSLFDDEDDDLFGSVAVASNKTGAKPETNSKIISDSDDDLFNEDKLENNAANVNYGVKANNTSLDTGKDSLFNGARDSIDEFVSNTRSKSEHISSLVEKSSAGRKTENEPPVADINEVETARSEIISAQDKHPRKGSQVKSMFDSDTDDDIFSDLKPVKNDKLSNKSKYNVIKKVNKNVEPHNTIGESFIKKVDSESVLSKADENDINNEEEDLFTDDLLFKNIEKSPESISSAHSNTEANKVNNENSEPLTDDSLHKNIGQPPSSIKELIAPRSRNKNSALSVNIDEFEDNKKKTDKVLTESIDKLLKIESNTDIHIEDKLFSRTNSNENGMQNKPLSSVLSTMEVSKTQIRSPSLFGDDDLDDIFSKNSNNITNEEIDNPLDNKIHTEVPNALYTEVISGFDDGMAYNNNSLISNVNGTQMINSNETEEPVLKNKEPEALKNVCNDLKQNTEDNLIHSRSDESEIPLPRESNIDFSIPISEEPMLKEKKEERNESKTEYNDITTEVIQEELFSDTKTNISGETDIFNDIFSDIPPEFERPKEPKKSKNVNALFDDDSDDEALFFKKSEIVTDEKPDVSFTSPDVRLFHIFHDEPPAMDIDFTQKSNKTVPPTTETPPNETYFEKSSSPAAIKEENDVKSLFRYEAQDDSSPFVQSVTEINIDAKKPVGKLKPMNFNINVNSLLPGASPKKTKTYEQVDGQVTSKSTEEEVRDEESKMVKSVSFEGDTESEVLDNKLSKERAKIQVKRRPSTRRARKEAVRKSGIDFGDDSTDNSNSTDISVHDKTRQNTDRLQGNNNAISNEKQRNTLEKLNKEVEKNVSNSDITDPNNITDTSKATLVEEAQLFNKEDTSITDDIKDNDKTLSGNLDKDFSESSMLKSAFNNRPNVKSKVVYILNDEDIFTDTKPVTLPDATEKESEKIVAKNKVINIVDDEDELFKSGTSKNTNIATLGNVYKDVNVKNNEIDSFDSDEDIFKASQSKLVRNTERQAKDNKHEIDKMEAKIDKLFVKTQSTKVKSPLFDDLSDDESELFGRKTTVKNSNFDNSDSASTIIKKDIKLPTRDPKRSLFGSESDNDDLFGTKTTKKEPAQSFSKTKEVTSKPAEPVFEDPLSMLSQDDDI